MFYFILKNYMRVLFFSGSGKVGVYILANSLPFGLGNNSAKIEIGEDIKEGTIKVCA